MSNIKDPFFHILDSTFPVKHWFYSNTNTLQFCQDFKILLVCPISTSLHALLKMKAFMYIINCRFPVKPWCIIIYFLFELCYPFESFPIMKKVSFFLSVAIWFSFTVNFLIRPDKVFQFLEEVIFYL